MSTISAIFASLQISSSSQTSGQQQSQSTGSSAFDQLMQQLGNDINNSNLTAAQNDFNMIEQQLQNGQSGAGVHHHRHHGKAESGIEQLLQAIDDTLNNIQSGLSGNSSSTSSSSAISILGLNITA